jgi:hypothetical protein
MRLLFSAILPIFVPQSTTSLDRSDHRSARPSSGWSRAIAERYALTLSADWAEWFDEVAVGELRGGEYCEPVHPSELLSATPEVIWPGLMPPDLMPVVGNGMGDWLCARVGPESTIREVVHWYHGGGDRLPLEGVATVKLDCRLLSAATAAAGGVSRVASISVLCEAAPVTATVFIDASYDGEVATDLGPDGAPDVDTRPRSTVRFAMRPSWAGVRSVEVFGAFGRERGGVEAERVELVRVVERAARAEVEAIDAEGLGLGAQRPRGERDLARAPRDRAADGGAGRAIDGQAPERGRGRPDEREAERAREAAARRRGRDRAGRVERERERDAGRHRGREVDDEEPVLAAAGGDADAIAAAFEQRTQCRANVDFVVHDEDVFGSAHRVVLPRGPCSRDHSTANRRRSNAAANCCRASCGTSGTGSVP